MSRKILPLILTAGLTAFFAACDDSSIAASVECLDDNCLDSSSSVEEEISSSSEKENKSSSSVKDEKSSSSEKSDKSSSSVKEDKSSSSTKDEKSSSSVKDEKSSSSEKSDKSSSSVKEDKSSSSSEDVSSSSDAPESSSSVKYLSTTPNLADLEVSGDTLFAVFQRLNGYSADQVGLLALYNRSTGELLDTISLATSNPMKIQIANGEVYVCTQGAYDAAYSLPADENRGIEKVNLSKKTSSLYVSGTKLGGGVNDFVINQKTGKAYAVVTSTYGNSPVVEIDLSSKATKKIESIKNAPYSMAYDSKNGLVYFADNYIDYTTYKMHIGVFSYDGTTLTSISDNDPEEEGRPPYNIQVLDGVPYVFVSDYSTGKLYIHYADSESEGVSYYLDSKLAVANGKLYLMERDLANGTLAEINTSTGKPNWQYSIGKGNAYDVVPADAGNLWIALYNVPEIRKVTTSGKVVTDGAINTEKFSRHE